MFSANSQMRNKELYTVRPVPTPAPIAIPMPMPTDLLQLELVGITPVRILKADLGSLLSLRPRTEGLCKIASWQHMVLD